MIEPKENDRLVSRAADQAGGSLERPGSAPGSSLNLLRKAQAGDGVALERLLERQLPGLYRWARGRLPRWARDISDTADLVQETVLHTIRRIGSFDPRHRHALQSYLRQAILNRIRNEYRRLGRRPPPEVLGDSEADRHESPLEGAIRSEQDALYHEALARLRVEDRAAIVGRLELNYSYEQLALVLGKPTPDAARVALRRAIVRLAAEMDRAHV